MENTDLSDHDRGDVCGFDTVEGILEVRRTFDHNET